MYHIEIRELRQFGNLACSFNLTEPELRVFVEPWVREQWVELGGRKWSPHLASLTVLEGPQLPMAQLSMGRGWRNARRHGVDATKRVLAAAREAGGVTMRPLTDPSASPSTPAGERAVVDEELQADSLGLGLLSLLEHDPAPLSRAWRLAQARFPERSASECLALAERAVSSLLQRRLIVLLAVDDGDAHAADAPDAARQLPQERIEPLLRTVDSWADTPESPAVRMRRA